MIVGLKRKDWILLGALFLIGVFIALVPGLVESYTAINTRHGLLSSFLKFAVLATAGEMIALRINCGIYYDREFGLLPRVVVWGMLGIAIKLMFILFANGVPTIWSYLSLPADQAFSQSRLTLVTIAGAFSISLAMNLVFSPLLFVIHNITDEHIRRCRGSIRRFFSQVQVHDILINLNWSIIWNFALKRTIPLFWLPAHTVTFLLPSEHRILAAALLSVMLGVIMAFTRFEGADFSRMATPILEKISEATQSTVFFGQIRGDQVYMATRCDYKKTKMISIGIGQRFPLYFGAHGKAIASALTENERMKIVQEHQNTFFPTGEPVDFNDFNKRLDVGLRRGFFSERSHSFPDLQVISSPVVGKGDHVLGCIILIGRFDDVKIEPIGYHVHSGALDLMKKIAS